MVSPPKVPATFTIAQIVLESAQLAHRSDYLSLAPNTPVEAGEVAMQVQVQVEENATTAVVRVTLSNHEAEGALYRFEVIVTGILLLGQPFNKADTKALAVSGGGIVFPFVRETVANLTGRGRFGQLWVQPVSIAHAIAQQESTLPTEASDAEGAQAGQPEPSRPRRKNRE